MIAGLVRIQGGLAQGRALETEKAPCQSYLSVIRITKQSKVIQRSIHTEVVNEEKGINNQSQMNAACQKGSVIHPFASE